MKQQFEFDVIHDPSPYEVAAAPRVGIKVDNREYAMAAFVSPGEAVKRPVPALEAAVGAVQPIPETLAGEYLDLLG